MLRNWKPINLHVRLLRQLANFFDIERPLSLKDFRFHVHEMQANRSASQSNISKLSVFYRSLSTEYLSSSNGGGHLNNALYFSALFMKRIPENLLQIAHDKVDLVEDVVLRALAQKLLSQDQWPIAEKLINKKFQANPSMAAIQKFEVFALNGNYLKMIEQLPIIAKSSSIPQEVQFQLLCLLNSKDLSLNGESKNYNDLFQIALKGKLLSKKPPTLESFIRLAESLSSQFELDPSLLVLGFTRSSEISEPLYPETLKLLKSVYRNCSNENLLKLANKLNFIVKKELNEDVVITLLERICKNPPSEMRRNVICSLLCWIIKFCPDKYSLTVLMTEFGKIIDANVARCALEASRLCDENCVKFIEYCLVEKGIQIEREAVKEAVDIASERFGFLPSQEFMREIHQRGYNLSSKFYLKQLMNFSYDDLSKLSRAYDCFKLISPDQLHGELLQQYLQASQVFMEKCIEQSNLEYCLRVHQKTAKYQVLKSLEAPKPFRNIVIEAFEAGKFSKPFRPTNNLECIRTALDCTQKSGHFKLTEKFCVTALQASLSNLDFLLAQRLSVYMNNQGYSHGDSSTIQNILLQWVRKCKDLN